MSWSSRFSVLAFALLLSGCGAGTMQDITQRADKAKTRAQLEAALGKPGKFEKVKMLGVDAESWTYDASDGKVTFTILNDRVTMLGTEAKTDSNSLKTDVKSKQKADKER